MSRQINAAVVGFGLAGQVFHCPFISAVDGLHLYAIVQRKGDEAAKAYPQTRILRSFEEALADPAIDLIVIATPNKTHFELAKRALEAGKHVVIDKPFAGSSLEAQTLITTSRTVHKIVAPFHNRRWDGDFLTVRKLIDSNQLGRIATFESHFDRFRPLQRENTWKESADPTNGLLFDLGPHLIDQAIALFGAPKSITASVRSDRDATNIEDAFDITLHYDHHLAHLRSTMLAAAPSPRFLIHGTHGSFTKHGVDPQEPALLAGQRPTDDTWLREPESLWGTLTIAPNPADPGKLVTSLLPTERGDYRNYYANVRDAINGTAQLIIRPQDALLVIHLLELARESTIEARTLPVSTSIETTYD